MINRMGTHRVVIPPSKRIHNWKSLPVEGAMRFQRRSAVLRTEPIFVATARWAAAAIARGRA